MRHTGFLGMVHNGSWFITSSMGENKAASRGYVIVAICSPVGLFVNSVTPKLIDGFSSNFHKLFTYA